MPDTPMTSAAGFVEGEPVPPDEATEFVRLACPEHGCDCVGVGVDEQDAREALHHHAREAHRG